MNIAFIFFFFIQNSQVWFINAIEKKPVYVYFMREIFEDENKTFFSKTKNRSNVHVVFLVRKYYSNTSLKDTAIFIWQERTNDLWATLLTRVLMSYALLIAILIIIVIYAM